jgi:hypothetical protein
MANQRIRGTIVALRVSAVNTFRTARKRSRLCSGPSHRSVRTLRPISRPPPILFPGEGKAPIPNRYPELITFLMPKTLMQSVVNQLQKERSRLADELRRVTGALTAFGKVYVSGPTATRKKRTISAAGRKRIAAAQRARWARVKAGKKH